LPVISEIITNGVGVFAAAAKKPAMPTATNAPGWVTMPGSKPCAINPTAC